MEKAFMSENMTNPVIFPMLSTHSWFH